MTNYEFSRLVQDYASNAISCSPQHITIPVMNDILRDARWVALVSDVSERLGVALKVSYDDCCLNVYIDAPDLAHYVIVGCFRVAYGYRDLTVGKGAFAWHTREYYIKELRVDTFASMPAEEDIVTICEKALESARNTASKHMSAAVKSLGMSLDCYAAELASMLLRTADLDKDICSEIIGKVNAQLNYAVPIKVVRR